MDFPQKKWTIITIQSKLRIVIYLIGLCWYFYDLVQTWEGFVYHMNVEVVDSRMDIKKSKQIKCL